MKFLIFFFCALNICCFGQNEIKLDSTKIKSSITIYFDDYDKYGYVIQKWVDTPLFSGQLPTLGLWMVGHQCAGMSIREDCYDIIGNDAHFAAHYFIE